jgi:hypothetical protein
MQPVTIASLRAEIRRRDLRNTNSNDLVSYFDANCFIHQTTVLNNHCASPSSTTFQLIHCMIYHRSTGLRFSKLYAGMGKISLLVPDKKDLVTNRGVQIMYGCPDK